MKNKIISKLLLSGAILLGVSPSVVFADNNEQIQINHPINVYSNAHEANIRGSEISIYDGGQYFIFNQTETSINISTQQNAPGAWINKSDVLNDNIPKEYLAKEDIELFKEENAEFLLTNKFIKKGELVKGFDEELTTYFKNKDNELISKSSLELNQEYKYFYLKEDSEIKNKEEILFKENKNYTIKGIVLGDKIKFVYNGKLLYLDLQLFDERKQEATIPAEQSVTLESEVVSQIISLARKQVGKPYVWGASGSNAFDCSSLIQYLFGSVGIKMPRTTYAQVNIGETVSWSNIQPGDLLHFADSTGYYHIALYIGNGQMLHASNEERGVVIDSVNSSWVKSDVKTIKRIK